MTRVDILVKNNKTRCTDFVFKTVHASTIECAKTKPFQTQEYIFAKNDEHLAYEWLYERKDDFEIFFECMTNSMCYDYFYIEFNNIKDAIEFKLRWG